LKNQYDASANGKMKQEITFSFFLIETFLPQKIISFTLAKEDEGMALRHLA